MAEIVHTCNLSPGIFRPLLQVWTAMPATSDERLVLLRLQEHGVVKQAELAEQLHRSPKTLQRLLPKVGYYRSLNHNSAFVTLIATPRFDDCGLWASQGVCFSRHGSLPVTLRWLIDQSPDGQTRQELQDKVLTTVHNHLSLLLRQQAIASFTLARQTVYTSADPQRQHQQEMARRPLPPGRADPTALPPGLDCLVVVRVLLRLLQTPQASSASLAKSLQARQLIVTADQIRQVIAFYAIKKTTR
jgi:hypothetical protein